MLQLALKEILLIKSRVREGRVVICRRGCGIRGCSLILSPIRRNPSYNGRVSLLVHPVHQLAAGQHFYSSFLGSFDLMIAFHRFKRYENQTYQSYSRTRRKIFIFNKFSNIIKK